MTSGETDVSAFPAGDDLFDWTGTIVGPEDTPYEGHTYKLSISFPTSYPHAAPTVRFTTPPFHPNVDTSGYICLDILAEKWAPSYTVRTMLLSLQSLLGDPNPDSPLNPHAAKLWRSNRDEYISRVRKAAPK